MRILITNDDGINAPGLEVLAEIAAEIAGPEGEVWTVAPAFEQSGVGHCISYTRPMMIAKLGERRFAAEGSPADCVIAALCDVMKDARPDLVLSGVNRGNNSGENVVYSGTIGAAMEGALHRLPAIALSQYMGPDTDALADPFEAARRHGAGIIRRLLAPALWEDAPYRLFYNVNFPPVGADAVKGIRAARQGARLTSGFSAESHVSPNGRRYLWLKGGPQQVPSLPDDDNDLNMRGYVSVTPLRADLTAYDRLSGLEAALA